MAIVQTLPKQTQSYGVLFSTILGGDEVKLFVQITAFGYLDAVGNVICPSEAQRIVEEKIIKSFGGEIPDEVNGKPATTSVLAGYWLRECFAENTTICTIRVKRREDDRSDFDIGFDLGAEANLWDIPGFEHYRR